MNVEELAQAAAATFEASDKNETAILLIATSKKENCDKGLTLFCGGNALNIEEAIFHAVKSREDLQALMEHALKLARFSKEVKQKEVEEALDELISSMEELVKNLPERVKKLSNEITEQIKNQK